MSQHRQDLPGNHENLPVDRALVIPLQSLDQTTRPLAGGKAANLGALIQAGFCVPTGFCITTAAYEQVFATAALDIYLAELETLARSENARQIELAQTIRTALCQTPLPTAVSEAITSAYQMLAAGSPIAVSVRSSATTEDLPDASFVGQQETVLNVIGSEAILSAVQHCFASLWTDRAIQYRSSLDIAPRNLAFGVQQGTYRPFTPLGMSALRYLSASFLTLIGSPPRDPLAGPRFVTAAASRPFFDVTAALRSTFGRRFLLEAMREAEVHAAGSFEQLITDPRLSLRPTSRYTVGQALILLLVRTAMPWYLLQAFLAPQAASRRVRRFVEQLRTTHQIDASTDAAVHLAEAERLLRSCLPLAFRVSPVMLAGMLSFALAQRLPGKLASASECQRVLGGSPTNPTTEMNLALWRLSQEMQADTASRDLLQQTSVTHLAQHYLHGQLPALLQQGLASFLQEYGHQSVCELDLGVARWSEDPTYVLTLLVKYLTRAEGGPPPEQQRQRAHEAAQVMIATLAQRARQQHWLHGWLVRVFLQRAHALAGFRETTRSVIGLRLAQARALLRTVGEVLAQKGKLQAAEDLFFSPGPKSTQH
ncbi:PEP/pyruvate-binding domain-containing protein [Dictyobacter formicarum]|uniref:Pyruvate phosphate dikinase AMP/ATP-binding domain-containing protein n=1 Tax=Dictyobacter formicarum TaxID=2778368 RepID=A0ABQ3VD80_9CHLR|nr:PEP/pyruvate-binding domain-containing protein [Dictyobacter formicarum]GHO84110.1 hypothetical protein KSZ_21160 [Dictyobacter formicarum]